MAVSNKGSCLAPSVLNRTAKAATAMVIRVPCHAASLCHIVSEHAPINGRPLFATYHSLGAYLPPDPMEASWRTVAPDTKAVVAIAACIPSAVSQPTT